MPPPLERFTRRRPPEVASEPPMTPSAHAERLSWPGEPPQKRFMPMLRRALETDPPPRVALVAGAQMDAWAELFSRAWPSVTPVLVHEDDNPSEAHVRLSLAAPFDVILQAADCAAVVQVSLFSRVYFHLREGGTYLTPRLLPLTPDGKAAARAEAAAWLEQEQQSRPWPNEDGALVAPYVGELWDVLAEALATRLRSEEDQPDFGTRTTDVRGLARHLRDVQVHGVSLGIRNARRTHAKLTEAEADAVLAARPELGREVESLPPTRMTARADYRHNLEADPYYVPDMAVPKLTLREYRDPACSRGQVVTSGEFVWPDTYRHHLAPRLHNYFVEESAPRFGVLRRDISEADVLPGAWFNLDSEWPGHYGHLLTELLGRMWAWDRVREIAPDVRCLLTLPPERKPKELVGFEVEALAAFGISVADVHVFDRPCRPETLYSATSMFSLPDYVHPRMVETWDRLGNHLAAQAGPGSRPRRIFCTRPTDLKRSCANTAEVEDLFARHGFEVIRPETYPLSEQVALFRGAEVIGGFGGSALFTSALCDAPKTIVTVAPTSYTARNEHLIAAARGHQIISAWTASRLAHPEGWWTQRAYASNFTVDMDVEGAFLDEQLRALGPVG